MHDSWLLVKVTTLQATLQASGEGTWHDAPDLTHHINLCIAFLFESQCSIQPLIRLSLS